MKTTLLLLLVLAMANLSWAQNGWAICTAPGFQSRVDDVFMVDTNTGYAVCGDGQIVKTTDGGNNWTRLLKDNTVYCRSVEFITAQKGFVGSFMANRSATPKNVLRKTENGGISWTDLTPAIDPRAAKGICGLAAPDNNTIYGCGNWYDDSGYIIKSVDGGTTWSFIDMGSYTSSVIDMHFINKDTGFVSGKDRDKNPAILYTTDGGLTWTYTFRYNTDNGYCWKIQCLDKKVYFASIETLNKRPPKIARSDDGGKTWVVKNVGNSNYYVEGIGFIDAQHGWTGGDTGNSFETTDGGTTWLPVPVCPSMNRVFRVNDTLLFASGNQLWKYTRTAPPPPVLPQDTTQYTSLRCAPNPVKGTLTIAVWLSANTHLMLLLFDAAGRQVRVIANTDEQKGSYTYKVNTTQLPAGRYFVVLKTHEDKKVEGVVVVR